MSKIKTEIILPADYETCGQCGFDHSYEYREAHEWHMKNGDSKDTQKLDRAVLRAITKAAEYGKVIGILDGQGLIETDRLCFKDHIELLIPMYKKATPIQRNLIVKAVERAYEYEFTRADIDPET